MSSSYDWDDHKDEIISLYEEGLSVPVIHKRIRSNVFKISERVLYDKLKEWNFPTDPATRRQRAARAREAKDEAMREQQQQARISESWSLPSNDVTFHTEDSSLGFPYDPMDTSFAPNPFHLSPPSNPEAQAGIIGSETPFALASLDFNPTFAMQQVGSRVSTRPSSNNLAPEFEMDDNQRPWSDFYQGQPRWSTDTVQRGDGTQRQSSAASRVLLHQSSSSSIGSASRVAKSRTIAGIPGVKAIAASYNRFVGPDPRSSLVSTDSGYAGSSRSSLCNNKTSGHRSSQSQAEQSGEGDFLSLYRIVCTQPHESTLYNPSYSPPPPCPECGFSVLHGLAWHANDILIDDFKRRIQAFSETKNICDKAGNTALHYAAAAGADFDRLNALIEWGVNYSQGNTRNQIFLHLIDPIILDFDLFNLLNIPGVRNLRDVRDHYGQTILHELCRRAGTNERRRAILRFFESEGFASGPLNCYGQTAAENTRMQDPSLEPMTTSSPPITWESQQRLIEQDHQVFEQAPSNPNYKHPETGSNIIHVLSRLQLDRKDRLDKLLEYICAGVNLSEYNREGELPLILFASQRPGNELKVETELYIESLLNGLTDRGSTEVHMRNRLGQTALYCACVDGSHFSVKLLIARGSNVNARTPLRQSILRATLNAQARAVESNNQVKIDNFKEVIALLERSGAVEYPSSLLERGVQSVEVRMANLRMN